MGAGIVSPTLLAGCRTMAEKALVDQCEIFDAVSSQDEYGSDKIAYAEEARIEYGRLQQVERVPNAPGPGDSSMAVGNYVVVFGYDVVVNAPALIRVNGGKTYDVQVVYSDKSDRTTVRCYCFELDDE